MKILYGLLVLGIIVFIHETGHFIAALICRVKVESFSIGMGPVLLHKKLKGIDWRISLFPIGGYCGLKGENEVSEDTAESNILYDKDSLYGVHPFKRVAIAFSGPFFNLLLTFFSFVIIAMTGYSYYSPSSKIIIASEIYPEIYSPAKEAGLLTGDVILSVNGQKTDDFNQLYSYISLHPNENLDVEALRNGEVLHFFVQSELDKATGSGKIGVAGDSSTVEVREAARYSFFPAAAQGIKQTGEIFIASIKSIINLFKGVKITQAVSGPASITTMLGETIEEGFKGDFRNGLCSILNFVALISISLFIMNLLPVPVLDGGLILLSLIEGIFSITISPKIRNRIQYVGLVFIAGLFLIAVIGDFNFFMRIFNEK